MAKFDIKTVKPKFVLTTSPDNKIEVVVNKPIIEAKNSKSFFQLKNTGGPRGLKGEKGDTGDPATVEVASTTTGAAGTSASVVNEGTSTNARLAFTIPKGDKGDKGDKGYSPVVLTTRKDNYVEIDAQNETFTSVAKVYDGEDGEAATVTVGSTTTGEAGTEASVVNSGTTSAAVLDFTIPKGDKGDTGSAGAPGSDGYSPIATVSKSGDTATITITDKNGTTTATVSDGQDGATGSPGQAATIAVDSTSTLPAGSSATVTNVGTSSAARLAFGIPKGDTGAAGADGDAATIAVGQVETLQPNQSAYVTNVGTSSAAIFNIGIPKGDKGDAGAGSGDMLASTYDPNGTVAAAGGIPDYVAGELPTVNNATLTIQKNGTDVATFTANSSTNTTANISVPTATSDLSNDSGFITSSSLPTKTSDLTNDGSDGTSTYVEADDLATVATTGAYTDLSGTPSLATVATSGSYSDLTNKPTIPAAQVNSDWDSNSGVSQILNKPTLATVATSGSYNDLSNKPTIPAAQVNSDWNSNSGVSEILNKPSLATVATSGSYNDLANKPTIPTVNDATLTILQNGINAGSFTANASSNKTISLTDTTYSAFSGASSSYSGSSGLVPSPAAGSQNKLLRGDGTWADNVVVGYLTWADGTTWGAHEEIYTDSNFTTPYTTTQIAEFLLSGKTFVAATSDAHPYYFTFLSVQDDAPYYEFTVAYGQNLMTLQYDKTNLGWKVKEYLVNDATLTIQKNGTDVATFTANASSNATANITVPTQFSDLSGTVGTAQIADGAVTSAKAGALETVSLSNYITASSGFTFTDRGCKRFGKIVFLRFTVAGTIGTGETNVGTCSSRFTENFYGAGRTASYGATNRPANILLIPGGNARIYSVADNTSSDFTVVLFEN